MLLTFKTYVFKSQKRDICLAFSSVMITFATENNK